MKLLEEQNDLPQFLKEWEDYKAIVYENELSPDLERELKLAFLYSLSYSAVQTVKIIQRSDTPIKGTMKIQRYIDEIGKALVEVHNEDV